MRRYRIAVFRDSRNTALPQEKTHLPFVIGVLAEKGGVGKTTSAVHIAEALARRGNRALLIDMDPQKNLTEWVGPDTSGEADGSRVFPDGRPEHTIFHVLEDPYADVSRAIVASRIEGVDLIPGARGLGLADRLLGTTKSGKARDPNVVLATALDRVPDDYQVIIIDGPPSVGQLNGNAIMAANLLIVPIEPGEFAFRGLTKIGITVMEMLDEHILQEAPAIAALLTLVKGGRKTNEQYDREARKSLKGYERGYVFKSRVQYREEMQRLPKKQRTAFSTSRTKVVAENYTAVADELIAMLEKMAKAA